MSFKDFLLRSYLSLRASPGDAAPGDKTVEIKHVAGTRVVLVEIAYGSAYEALVRYEHLSQAMASGRCTVNFTTGEVLDRKEPRPPEPWTPATDGRNR